MEVEVYTSWEQQLDLKLDQNELEDVSHEPPLVWTTVGNFSSIEDLDQIFEGESDPRLDRLNESNSFLGIESLGVSMPKRTS
jgi:hypothetical protein